jgi:hypothetical protein
MIERPNKGKKPPRYQHRVDEHKRLWRIWNGMKRRCLRPNEPRYKDYGGRGITLAQEWLNFDNFAEWALSHGYTDELTIERIDVDGNYCPENCKWITRLEQCKNKRDTLWVMYHGKKVRLQDLAETAVVSYDTVHDRIYKRGWDIERALTTPSDRERVSLMQKCREAGMNYGTVKTRIVRFGWSEEEALRVPSEGRGTRPHRA